jgi:hypothetical protein
VVRSLCGWLEIPSEIPYLLLYYGIVALCAQPGRIGRGTARQVPRIGPASVKSSLSPHKGLRAVSNREKAEKSLPRGAWGRESKEGPPTQSWSSRPPPESRNKSVQPSVAPLFQAQ